MRFTDIFIRRPVLALVVSALILVLGLRSMSTLSILQYPRTQNAIVTVSTAYAGADSDIIAGFITTPLENAIAQANGIDYMTSSSVTGTSTITVNLRLNYDSGKAMTEINAKVSSVLNQFPSGTQQPTLTLKVGQTIDAMYIGFASEVLAPNQITDYLTRVVQPRLQAVPGVQTAELLGAKKFALRAWLDPDKLAAYGLTASDVSTALSGNDYISGLGATKGRLVQVDLAASTNLHSLEQYRNLVIKSANGAIIRLRDVANVTLGNDDYDSETRFNGKTAVYIGIQAAPTANLLDVINGVKAVLPDIKTQLPNGLVGEVLYDSTDFVNSSISEVVHSLLEAVLIVIVVVFMFLGSWRSVLIPVIAIPLSLIGTFGLMLLMGFSINLLTLLALVLAIGLVVDDAIIVVESVHRLIDERVAPVEAAIQSARALASPIIAMTVVLIAVYVPVGFQGGLTGALFTEFAFTLAGAVTVSAVIALTLSPMNCAWLLRRTEREATDWEARLVRRIDHVLEWLSGAYRRRLEAVFKMKPVVAVFALLLLAGIPWLYASSTSELAPDEDQGVVLSLTTAAPSATLQQRQFYGKQLYDLVANRPETKTVFQIDTSTQVIGGWVLKPWDQRSLTTKTLQPDFQNLLNTIAGTRSVAFQPSPLPGSNGLPIQFVIGTTGSFNELDEVSRNFMTEAIKSGQFIFLDTDLKVDKPQTMVMFDRDKAGDLGLKMSDVGGALATMLGGNYLDYFSLDGRSYKVIPQARQNDRLTAGQLLGYYIRASDNSMVPLSTIAHLDNKTVPQSRNHFQQINAATISGVAMPNVSMGSALATLKQLAKSLPAGYSVDFGGASRQLEQESGGFVTTFAFAVIIIFLALAALFNSFLDPVIILVSVPMSLAGALIFISLGLGGASLNIYTQVGLLTLMGLVSKHGILMVEVANELRAAGKDVTEAIVEAAAIRLRPILMTTAAMVLGVVPLITASGAGAVSRYNMGLVIATGLSIGTLFTLFVVPVAYALIARPAPLQAHAAAA
ncbi:efflux RND transporter permease subunit [Bradyrhizobium guangdongense]|uniref:Acriflavine resistance protein B n=1 Tax=Bradyrhizobium guangdongense TaxID=1325090 RepID=A0A410V5R3_9BRAD|nr:efflux RND transporter permease subunit [Bradyrhizobium guangdongense]QAU38980.1 multidrug efflux protein [Bradyrhizobium guangdongense]QOZ60036.1 multidrug efflux protein [Bradyrhizobium guangdongense]GGI23482.1 acriflavine resistance protein B [Bradyrhizobium guangdongense]